MGMRSVTRVIGGAGWGLGVSMHVASVSSVFVVSFLFLDEFQ